MAQIGVEFHNGLMREMDDFVGAEKPFSKYQDFIRQAVREKIDRDKANA